MERTIAPVLSQEQARITISALRCHADVLVASLAMNDALDDRGRRRLRRHAAELALIADHIADAFDPRRAA